MDTIIRFIPLTPSLEFNYRYIDNDASIACISKRLFYSQGLVEHFLSCTTLIRSASIVPGVQMRVMRVTCYLATPAVQPITAHETKLSVTTNNSQAINRARKTLPA